MRTFPLFLVLLVTLPLLAQSPNNEVALAFGQSRFTENAGDSSGEKTASLSYNRFWTSRISTRFALVEYGVDFAIDLGGRSGVDISAKTLTVEYHFLRDETISPHVGAGAAYAKTGVSGAHVGGSSDYELTGLVTAGADVNVSRSFAVGLDVTYMPYRPELSNGNQPTLHPLTVAGAIKFRW